MKADQLSKPNAFAGHSSQPTESELSQALGAKKRLWDDVIAILHDECPTAEWSSYSVKVGWSLKLKKKARTIVYLGPLNQSFRVGFVLGGKAVKAARDSGLPKRFLQLLDQAPKYPEGTAVRFEITSSSDVQLVARLAAIKISN